MLNQVVSKSLTRPELRGYTAMNNISGSPLSATRLVESNDGGATWSDLGNILIDGKDNVVGANGPVFAFTDVDDAQTKLGWFMFGESAHRGVHLMISTDEGLTWTAHPALSFANSTIRSGDANFISDSLVRLFYYRNTGTIPSDRQLWYQDFALAGMANISPNNLFASADTTPPIIVPSVTPMPNPAGWNQTNVTVSWSVTDPESGIASSSGCGTTTLTAETAGTALTCSATNGAGLSNSVSVTIKIDKTPPSIACSVSPNTLWPPNHKLAPVIASVTVGDSRSGPDGFTLLSAASNEADNGFGDGDTPNDIQGFVIGTASKNGLLRAERSGLGTGRIYTLTYRGKDKAGNTATCSAVVTVSHDQGKK